MDLYIIGANLTAGTSTVFSYETTPKMEVALAVKASVSIPLFFEAVTLNQPGITGNDYNNVYCDGGIINNFPIKLFDSAKYASDLRGGVNMSTLGIRFKSGGKSNRIDNLFDYIWSLVVTAGRAQEEAFYNDPMDMSRSISIDSMDISPIDFSIRPGDNVYQQLYQQGYLAAKAYYDARQV